MQTLDYHLDMNARTVDWAALRAPQAEPATAEGLRERKKRKTRQQLTDTATEMFLERGFDSVRVSEIAEACGVSEKTVFNYFPTKESLILDHPDATLAALRTALADPDPGVTPIDAVLRILADDLNAVISWLGAQADRAEAISHFRRFGALIQTTPSLRAYQRDMTEQLIGVAAEVLADRAGMSAADPEPQIAATALVGLWRIQFGSMARHLDGNRTPARVRNAITADVHRAAQLLATGLATFPVTANRARKQVKRTGADAKQPERTISAATRTARPRQRG
jgi:AcrR family transcriptional regulator